MRIMPFTTIFWITIYLLAMGKAAILLRPCFGSWSFLIGPLAMYLVLVILRILVSRLLNGPKIIPGKANLRR
jgi:hypothetical protein